MWFLKCQTKVYEAIENSTKKGQTYDTFHLIEWALRELGDSSARYLREDESFVVADIEMGMHGHLGPNGSRGSPTAFARMGRKANVGHSHQASIKDGVYTAGYSAQTDLGYNKGPSS